VRFIVLKSVVQEIESNLSATGGKSGVVKFRLAKDLLSRCDVEQVPASLAALSVDEQLLRYTKETHGVLATNDRVLRTRARLLGLPVLTLRGRKRICLEGTIT
jgi:rRNA-processing protein FCF1